MAEHQAAYSLYLMRHGLAVEPGHADFPDDAARPLTPKGEKRVEQIAAGLIQTGFAVDWIVTSPLVRAKQTAELVAASLDSKDSKIAFDSCEALSPGGAFGDIKEYLSGKQEHRRVLLVGHEPDLGRLASRLIGMGKGSGLAFKKGGCCLIHWDDLPLESTGMLVWWLTPRLLRALGKKK